METLSVIEMVMGAMAVIASILVIAAPNPIVSAMSLLATLFLTGGLYLAMGSYFIGAVQILVYAGAIAVLFAFIVMLLDIKPIRVRLPGRAPIVALGIFAGLCFVCAGVIATLQSAGHFPEAAIILAVPTSLSSLEPVEISRLFVSKYMVAFQMTGFLMLAAIVGAILLGRPEKTSRYG